MNLRSFTKVTECLYVDGAGKVYFLFGDFLKTNRLPDTGALREVIMQDIQDIMPGILILERWADVDSKASDLNTQL